MGGGLAGRKSLGRLAVMSELEIRSLAVQRCDRATNCGDCVALQVFKATSNRVFIRRVQTVSETIQMRVFIAPNDWNL